MTVEAARDRYLEVNGFSTAGYSAATFQVDVFGRTWTLPNRPARRRAIPLHDLHHVVTGYGTDLAGEAETSTWELSGGINSLFLWCFKLSAIAIGLVIAPRRVLQAARAARGCRTLYRDPIGYAAILAMTLGELRARLGVPPDGQARRAARLHRRAPGSRG